MASIGPAQRALIAASVVNGSLGMAAGALVAGVLGAKLGLILGLLLAVLPIATREASAWLGRPDGLFRFVIAQIATAVIGTAQVIANIVGSLVARVAGLMQGPVVVVRILIDVLARAFTGLLGRLWRLVATPLGMANVAATAVIAANLAGLDFASPVAFLGLGMLVLVLLVSESERRDEEAASQPRSEE